jgi:hypothetical protein
MMIELGLARGTAGRAVENTHGVGFHGGHASVRHFSIAQ